MGGGQLGRMIALAARPLGIRCTVYDPSFDPCAISVAHHIRGEYEHDYAALYEFVRHCDAITYEFENVPVETARWLNERVPVYPPPRALEVSQDRVVEKTFLNSLGVPTAAFRAVESRADFNSAIADIGLPAVLKTRRFGYDGKGQAVLRSMAEAEAAWTRLGGRPLILEELIPFDRELSVIAVRAQSGEVVTYPLCENTHADGILRRTIAPADRLGEELPERAAEFVTRVLTELDYVGVLAIEWFQDGPRLIANEMAPRVHNSGHWTQDGAVTSQFENHARAVLGMPLGSPMATGFAVMDNLVGTCPPVAELLADPAARVHLYEKPPRAGRKLGHVTRVFATRGEMEVKLV